MSFKERYEENKPFFLLIGFVISLIMFFLGLVPYWVLLIGLPFGLIMLFSTFRGVER
jgi:hypothetical protein